MANKSRRPMRFETLEDKRLLAGDITADVVLGNLILRGDGLANGVGISSGDTPGEVIVGGLEAGGHPTSINGSFERVTFRGVHESIRVGLGAGDDRVHMPSLAIRGQVTVLAGEGDDQVAMGEPATMDRPHVLIGGQLSVQLGDGNDRFALLGSRVGGGIRVDGGPGDDAVRIADARVAGLSAVYAGAGDDHVSIQHSALPLLRLGTGDGADRVELVDSVFSRLSVHLGDGNDRLELDGVRARAAQFVGGPGERDLLVRSGENRLGRLHVAGFEAGGGSLNDVALVDDGHADRSPLTVIV